MILFVSFIVRQFFYRSINFNFLTIRASVDGTTLVQVHAVNSQERSFQHYSRGFRLALKFASLVWKVLAKQFWFGKKKFRSVKDKLKWFLNGSCKWILSKVMSEKFPHNEGNHKSIDLFFFNSKCIFIFLKNRTSLSRTFLMSLEINQFVLLICFSNR